MVRRIQTSFPLVVFVSVVDLRENMFLFASAVGAPCEGFLGLTSGFAKIASVDQIICSKIYLKLPGLDFPVLTADVSSYRNNKYLKCIIFSSKYSQWGGCSNFSSPRRPFRTLQKGCSQSHDIEIDSGS